MLKAEKILPNLIILLICLYYAQGILYATGSIVSQISLLAILSLGLISIIKTCNPQNFKKSFFLYWTILLIFNVIGFLFTSDLSNSIHVSNIKNILITSFSFYIIFYISKYGDWKIKHLYTFLIIIIPISIIQFYNYEKQQLLLVNQKEIVNNISYTFVGFIPFLFFIKKRVYIIGLLLIILFFIFVSGKRGAAITGVFGIVVYLFYHFKLIAQKAKIKRLINYIGLSSLLYVFIIIGFRFLERKDFLLDRLSSGYASNRDENYTQIFNYWYNSLDYINLIFGFGFGSSINMNNEGVLAHNDWLELLSSFGLVGIFIYTLLIYSFYKAIKDVKELNFKYSLFSILIMWLLISLFSMFYNSLDSYIYCIIIGSVLGWNERNKIIE